MLSDLWRQWKRAVLSGRTETLGGVEYHETDCGRYFTPWREGRLIPAKTFFARQAKERGKKRRGARRVA